MNKRIIIFSGVGVTILAAGYYLYKRKASSNLTAKVITPNVNVQEKAISNPTVSNTPISSGSNPSQSSAPQSTTLSMSSIRGINTQNLQSSSVLSNRMSTAENEDDNNYVLSTKNIISALTDSITSGTVADGVYSDVANSLSIDLNSAWTNSSSGVPMYDNSPVLQIYGTNGNGYFSMPSTLGLVYGSQNDKLKAVWGNACMVIAIAAKNTAQARYKGQCKGQFQSQVISHYKDAINEINNVDSLKPYADNLIGAFKTSILANGNGVTQGC